MAKARRVEPKPKRITWGEAANKTVAAINGKTTLSRLAEQADTLFVEAGGQSNLRVATVQVRRALDTAEAIGAVVLTRPTDVLVSKAK